MTLPAIETAEKIIVLIGELEEEQLDEALEKLETAGALYGLVWGFGEDRDDIEIYEVKQRILRFAKELRSNRDFIKANLVCQSGENRKKVEAISK